MRGINREVLARDAAWSLADGSCKELNTHRMGHRSLKIRGGTPRYPPSAPHPPPTPR